MIAIRNFFPNGCMAPNGCDDPDCDLCVRIANLPQPGQIVEPVARVENPERDGAPKLSGERKRGNLAFQKRRRVGPHR